MFVQASIVNTDRIVPTARGRRRGGVWSLLAHR